MSLDLDYGYIHDKMCELIKYIEDRYGIDLDEQAVDVVLGYMQGVVVNELTREKK